jgi:hypothetical protein
VGKEDDGSHWTSNGRAADTALVPDDAKVAVGPGVALGLASLGLGSADAEGSLLRVASVEAVTSVRGDCALEPVHP